MAFVKLDCGILDSTIWFDKPARDIFITALLMAEPFEARSPIPQIKVGSLDETGFLAPPGWYGLVHASGPGLCHRAGVQLEIGMEALVRCGDPESESRTPDFGGRRMIRVDGGFLILNYDKYRLKDYSTKERSARYRAKQKAKALGVTLSELTVDVTHSTRDKSVSSRLVTRDATSLSRVVTQAEAEAEAEAEEKENTKEKGRMTGFDEFWELFPKKHGRSDAEVIWSAQRLCLSVGSVIEGLKREIKKNGWDTDYQFCPRPALWLEDKRYLCSKPKPKEPEDNRPFVHPEAYAQLSEEERKKVQIRKRT